jgi:hypothetical protein
MNYIPYLVNANPRTIRKLGSVVYLVFVRIDTLDHLLGKSDIPDVLQASGKDVLVSQVFFFR